MDTRMNGKLLIVDTSPYNNQDRLKSFIGSHNHPPLTIYFVGEGVIWLDDDYWDVIYNQDVVYYANAMDAIQYNVNFQSDVIFSSENTLEQLLGTAEKIIYLSHEDTIKPKINTRP